MEFKLEHVGLDLTAVAILLSILSNFLVLIVTECVIYNGGCCNISFKELDDTKRGTAGYGSTGK